jgi:adenosylcobyric acid synthase
LGLLPVHTTLEKEKTTVRRRFHFGSPDGPLCEGYEIHMGTTVAVKESPLNFFAEAQPDGYYHSATCWGTYMHGILDNRAVVEELLLQAGGAGLAIQWSDYALFKQQQYDRLAEHIRQNVDLQAIYRSLRQPVTD